eukprot:scaffold17740_cov69-Phaeocystis_antarctica.AAC.3
MALNVRHQLDAQPVRWLTPLGGRSADSMAPNHRMLPYATPKAVCVQGAYPNRPHALNTYCRCAWVRTVFPNSPNSPQFHPIRPIRGARARLNGTGADVATVSSRWLYGLPQPRPHLWYYFFRHRYQLAPIGAAAPVSDLMVSRSYKLQLDDEVNSQIANGSDPGTCRPRVTSVGDLPTSSVSARHSWSPNKHTLRERTP